MVAGQPASGPHCNGGVGAPESVAGLSDRGSGSGPSPGEVHHAGRRRAGRRGTARRSHGAPDPRRDSSRDNRDVARSARPLREGVRNRWFAQVSSTSSSRHPNLDRPTGRAPRDPTQGHHLSVDRLPLSSTHSKGRHGRCSAEKCGCHRQPPQNASLLTRKIKKIRDSGRMGNIQSPPNDADGQHREPAPGRVVRGRVPGLRCRGQGREWWNWQTRGI